MTQAKSSKSGFRKGFLLTATKQKPTKKKAAASSDLLHLEDDQSTSLLIVNNTDKSDSTTPDSPFHVALHDSEENENSASLGITEVSTRRTPQLIEEVTAENLAGSKLDLSFEPSNDNKPLLSEVSSTRISGQPDEHGNDSSRQLHVVETDWTRGNDSSQIHALDASTKDTTSPCTESNVNDSNLVVDQDRSLLLTQELRKVLLKLQRQDDQAAHDFVTKHLQSDKDWFFVWDSILEDVVQDSTHPSVRLGMVLLQQQGGLDSIVPFLRPTDNKHSRILALGAAELIGSFVRSLRETKKPIKATEWLTIVLPELTNVVMATPAKRSLLAQRCMSSAYEIVATVATQPDTDQHDKGFCLLHALSAVDDLLRVQQGWIEKSLPSAESASFEVISRKRCTLAVLVDWRSIIKETQRLFESIQIKGGADLNHSSMQLTQVVCTQFSGANVSGLGKVGVGGLSQSLTDHPPKLSAEQILTCMQGADQLLCTIRETKDSLDSIEEQSEDLRSILRGVAAWMGQSKKHLHKLNEQPTQGDGTESQSDVTAHKMMTDLCIRLLRTDKNESVDLVLAILNHLWSSSSGLPPDLVQTDSSESTHESKQIPASFSLLLDELQKGNESDSEAVEPDERALCSLVSRCIQFGGPSLATELLSRNRGRSTTIEVLSHILLESGRLNDESSHQNKQLRPGDSTALSLLVGEAFLECIGSSSYARKKLLSSPKLLCNLSADKVIPKLVPQIEKEASQTSSSSAECISAVTAAMDEFMISSLPNNVDHFIRVLISSLAQTQQRLEEEDSETPNDLFKRSVVGDEQSLNASTKDEVQRINLAVTALIRECLHELTTCCDTKTVGEEVLFQRLSPLLLLRRLPATYYRVALDGVSETRPDLVPLLSQLADQLAMRLDISQQSSAQPNIAFSQQERKLSAEIAGGCLPFYAPTSCSCFHHICLPAFSSALQALKATSVDLSTSLRAARGALYACLRALPLAHDDDPGEGLLATVVFVQQVVNVELRNDDDDPNDDLIQLQTGCIEFVALSFTCALPRRIETDRLTTGKIMESDSIGKSESESDSVTIAEALEILSRSIISSLTTGIPLTNQPGFKDIEFFREHIQRDENPSLSVPARTCFWNALLLISQRCPEDDGRLHTWARLTAPWVLDWGSQAPVDDNLRHPLCMAAALQIVFVLITRTKSLGCLSKSVHQAHKWAVQCIQSVDGTGGGYAQTTMRKAALKLLLALFTMDARMTDNVLQNALSPGELGATFTILQGTANVDSDATVRKLAESILMAMRIP